MKKILAIIIFIIINICGGFYLKDISIDLTSDNIFTISPQIKKMVRNIDQPVSISLYASSDMVSEFPSMNRYYIYVKDFLKELSEISNGNITFTSHRLEAFSEIEDDILKKGLTPIPIKGGKSLFFGIIVENEKKEMAILPLLSPSRESMLEFDIAHLIDGIGRLKKHKIAIHSSLPLSVGSEGIMAIKTGNIKPFAIYNELKSRYNITHLSKDFSNLNSDNSPKVALLLHPRSLTETAEDNLRKYLAGGGRVIMALDPFSEYPQPFADIPELPHIMSSNLNKILMDYGLNMDDNNILIDPEISLKGRDPHSGKIVDYMAWIRPNSNLINKKFPFLSYVNTLSFGSVGYIEYNEKSPDLAFTPLIETSDNASKLPIEKIKELKHLGEIKQYYKPDRSFIFAGMLSGQFPYNGEVSSKNKSHLVVFADSDFIDDRFWIHGSKGNFTPFADNGMMFLNLIDVMLGDSELVSLRGRDIKQRPLTYLDNIMNSANKQFQIEEVALNKEIKSLQDKINLIRANEGDKNAIEKEVSKFTKILVEKRKKLREVRRNLGKDLSRAKWNIIMINIIIIPVLIPLFICLFMWFYRRNVILSN